MFAFALWIGIYTQLGCGAGSRQLPALFFGLQSLLPGSNFGLSIALKSEANPWFYLFSLRVTMGGVRTCLVCLVMLIL